MFKELSIVISFMLTIFVGFPLVTAYASEKKPSIDKIDNHVAQQHVQLSNPDKLLGDLKVTKKKVKPTNRSAVEGPIQEKDMRKNLRRSVTTHRDFTIYNFERIDDDLSILRDDNLYLTAEVSEIREREKVYIEALEGLLVRSKRYDHFFTKWDDLKDSFKGLWAVGGGSFLTAMLGGLGFWIQKRRKRLRGKNNGSS